MTVPNIFGSATSAIPLSQLDQNFATAITLGNTAVYLGNTTTSLGNVTLTNVTISSGNVSVSTATVGAGSNTAPSITTTGDTNTGIFFPAADTIAFAEGGVEAMRIDSSGRVGIGTSPAYPLQVSTTSETNIAITGGTASETNIFFGDSGSATIGRITYNNNGDYMRFNVDASERMRIDSDGNVSIGITSFASRFTSYSGASGDPLTLGYFAASSTATGGSSAGLSIIASSNKMTLQTLSGDSLGLQTDGSATDAITLETGGGLSISRTAVTSPAAGDGNVFSGTYTPTLTNSTNVAASTAVECFYMRVGNVVTVSGQVSIDVTTTATDSVLLMTLPVASTFTVARNCGGTGASSTAGTYGTETIAISANVANGAAEFRLRPTSVANLDYRFSFSYRVL